MNKDLCKKTPSELAKEVGFYGAMDDSLMLVSRCGEICGETQTVWALPGDLSYLEALLIVCRPGTVVVIDAGGNRTLSCLTRDMLEQLVVKGVSGVVINGTVSQYFDVDIPVYACSIHPLTTLSQGGYRIGAPVVCGGVSVLPNEYLIGNEDGIVVVNQ